MKVLAEWASAALALFVLFAAALMVGGIFNHFGATDFQQGSACMATLIGLPKLVGWLSEKAGS